MKRQKGVSLIELMFALAVIAIALLGIVGVILHTISVKEATREQQMAKHAATRKLEEIRTAAKNNFNNVTIAYDNTNFTVPELRNTQTATKEGLGSVVVDETNPDLLDIRILIVWEGVRGETRYEVRSLVTR